jgi:hypothetical protein
MLLLLNWTALSAQMQDFRKDSTIKYNQQELSIISLKLIEGKECAELLSVANKELVFSDSVILSQKDIIRKQKMQVRLADTVMTKQTETITGLTNDISKAKTKITWIKIGWVSTTLAIISLWIYSILP